MSHGRRRLTSAGLGIIIADTMIRYIAPAFGIRLPSAPDQLIFIAIGALFTALVADVVYKKSYQSLEERYEEESRIISKDL